MKSVISGSSADSCSNTTRGGNKEKADPKSVKGGFTDPG
jgi:hypothetical protein